MRNESRRARPFAAFPKRLGALAALLAAGVVLLGSSVSFCESPDIYTSARDLSHDFSYRWGKGRGANVSLWTPDGSRIVFSHAGGIYVVEADGTELTSLSGSYKPAHMYSKTAEIDFSPTLSPDGSRVAYATLRYAEGELYEHTYEIAVQSLDGSDRVRLTNNGRDDIAPAWSPDGSRIAFASPYGRDDMRIYTIAPDGSDEREIAASAPAACCVLAWSPDGGRLAFLGERRETGQLEVVDTYDSSNHKRETIPDYMFRRQSLYTVKADGSGLVELAWAETPPPAPNTRFGMYNLRAPEEWVSSFQWSADGERIAFVARRYGEKDGIYIADAEGASVRRIFDFAAISDFKKPIEDERFIPGIAFANELIYEIAWSQDGSRIEFEASVVRGDSYTPAVYSVSADGSDLRPLVEKESTCCLELSEKIKVGSGPKRIRRYTAGNPNAAPEVREWLLSTAPWGESKETVLVKIVDNRLTAVDPDQPVDAGAECEKAVPSGQRTSGLMRDCRTLLEMQYALADNINTDDATSYWTGYRPISEWRGVTIEDGRVRALEHIPGIYSGPIPPKIAELTELRTLKLEVKELVGEIPPELGSMSKLEILDLSSYGYDLGNHLAGWIPPELGNLSNLRILDLSRNELRGEIPAELGRLSNLEILNLSGNELGGEIPPELGGLSNLEELYLGGNQIHGEIPPELGKLSNLRTLYLENGLLRGSIPPELGDLENLQKFSTSGSRLTGDIPPELGSLSNLRALNLRGKSGAGLTGRIPGELGNLTNLDALDLSENRLEGPIPRELANLKTLNTLLLEDNDLEGPIPRELSDVVSLHHIDVTGNHRLTGCVPAKRRFSWDFYADLPPCE